MSQTISRQGNARGRARARWEDIYSAISAPKFADLGLKLACAQARQTRNSDHTNWPIPAHAPAPALTLPGGLACLYSATPDPQFAELGLKRASAVATSTQLILATFQRNFFFVQRIEALRAPGGQFAMIE